MIISSNEFIFKKNYKKQRLYSEFVEDIITNEPEILFYEGNHFYLLHHTTEKKTLYTTFEKVNCNFNRRVYNCLKRLMTDNPETNSIINRINNYEHLYTSEGELEYISLN